MGDAFLIGRARWLKSGKLDWFRFVLDLYLRDWKFGLLTPYFAPWLLLLKYKELEPGLVGSRVPRKA